MKPLALMLFGATSFLLWGCQTKNASPVKMDAAPDEPALQFSLPASIPAETILATARDALVRREWQNVKVGDGAVTATLVHRKMDASLRIAVNGSQVSIYSDSWRLDSDGARKKREHPEGWIRNLQKDITAALVPAT